MTTAIEVDKLGKKYIVRQRRAEPYLALREEIAERARAGMRRLAAGRAGRVNEPAIEEFWALKDVSFSVPIGGRVGIIGRNGAGKSTLLKVISRITEPTEGRIAIRGRAASMLEVGTGFHPELSGRENIFLNGAILGMPRSEITRKFANIVEFAGVERFLETPVKRYSSGMYVRLAFSVAAHLEPDVLMIDEVLAVGDVEFQKKCLGKMREVGRDGRTVLFVSHNMTAVEQLCDRIILLEKGSIRRSGTDVRAIINHYMAMQLQGANGDVAEWINLEPRRRTNRWLTPLRLYLSDSLGKQTSAAAKSDEVYLNVEAQIEENDRALMIGYALYSEEGGLLYMSFHTDQPPARWPRIERGRTAIRCRLPSGLLNNGEYTIELIAAIHPDTWVLQPGTSVPTIRVNVHGKMSESPYWTTQRPGLLGPILPWEAAA